MEHERQQAQQPRQARQSTGGAMARPIARAPLPIPGTAPPSPQETTPTPSKRTSGWLIASALGAGMIAAVAGALWSPSPSATAGDSPLSVQEVQQRNLAFQNHGPLKLASVLPSEQAVALQQMKLSGPEQQAIEKDLADGKVKLVWITLWDDMVEDGDVVEIQSTGFNRVVSLTKAKQRLSIPVPASGSIQMKGVRDGGGGITVAAETESGPLPIPVMAPGQTVAITVSSP